MRFQPLIKTLLCVTLITATSAFANPAYIFTDLSTLGGPNSAGVAINDNGQVTGTSDDHAGKTHTFLYANGVMTNILPTEGSTPTSMNNSGNIVGYSDKIVGFSLAGIYLTSNGTVTDFANLPGSNANAFPEVINDLGQIAGSLQVSPGVYDAFIYSNGAIHDLGFPSAQSNVTINAINNAGQFTGYVQQSVQNSFSTVAFLYADNTFKSPLTLDAAPLTDFFFSQGNAINNSGEVAGVSSLNNGKNAHVFLYSNNSMFDLGTPGGNTLRVYGMNDAGEIVGTHGPASNGLYGAAYIYTNNTFTDLNTLIDPSLGYFLTSANGINNLGQITGWALAPNGNYHAFLLTPIPEPTTLSLLALATPLFLKRRRPF